jgi:hypothetical protein
MPEFLIQARMNADVTVKAKDKDAAYEKVTKWLDALRDKAEMGKMSGCGVECDGIDYDEWNIEFVAEEGEEHGARN